LNDLSLILHADIAEEWIERAYVATKRL